MDNNTTFSKKLYKVSTRTRSGLVSRSAIHHSICICKTPIKYKKNKGETDYNGLINPTWERIGCSNSDHVRCPQKCDKVWEYTDRVCGVKLIDSAYCALFGFLMNLLDGLDDKCMQYNPIEDFHDINVTVSLLGLYGYKNENNKFIAFPFHLHDSNFRSNLHGFMMQQPEKWRSANTLDILNASYDGRWDTAINLFRQILDYINPLKDTINLSQRTLFDMAIEAWKEGANDPYLLKLGQSYP